MRENVVKRSYENNPNRWNVSITTLIGGAAVAVAFYVNVQLKDHSKDELAHPVIMSQLADLREGQKRQEILQADERICQDPDNTFYRQYIIKLIQEFERISGHKFPKELLRCATNGNP